MSSPYASTTRPERLRTSIVPLSENKSGRAVWFQLIGHTSPAIAEHFRLTRRNPSQFFFVGRATEAD